MISCQSCDRILGFTAFAVGAGEILATVQIAMTAGLPYTVLTQPTLVEGLIPRFSSAAATDKVVKTSPDLRRLRREESDSCNQFSSKAAKASAFQPKAFFLLRARNVSSKSCWPYMVEKIVAATPNVAQVVNELEVKNQKATSSS